MPRFRKKPVEIEAVQLSWLTWNEVCDLVGEFPEGMKGVYVRPGTTTYSATLQDQNDEIGLLIPTLEGTMLAKQGDWVIKGVKGEIYPCKPDIFDLTYEPVTENDRPEISQEMAWKLQDALSEAAEALGRDRGTRSESIASAIRALRTERDELARRGNVY
jgi:hypothetical protein